MEPILFLMLSMSFLMGFLGQKPFNGFFNITIELFQ